MEKFLKILIFILVAIFLLVILGMFLSPKKMAIAESTTIDAPPMLVYNLVDDFKNWEKWSPWKDLDPDAINTYSKNSEGVGARWSWKGNSKVGQGSQKIIAVESGKSINLSLIHI